MCTLRSQKQYRALSLLCHCPKGMYCQSIVHLESLRDDLALSQYNPGFGEHLQQIFSKCCLIGLISTRYTAFYVRLMSADNLPFTQISGGLVGGLHHPCHFLGRRVGEGDDWHYVFRRSQGRNQAVENGRRAVQDDYGFRQGCCNIRIDRTRDGVQGQVSLTYWGV